MAAMNVTAPKREAVATSDASAPLNPAAEEFVPWWRAGSSWNAPSADASLLNPAAEAFVPSWRIGGSWKPLSADAPEFVPAARRPAPTGESSVRRRGVVFRRDATGDSGSGVESMMHQADVKVMKDQGNSALLPAPDTTTLDNEE